MRLPDRQADRRDGRADRKPSDILTREAFINAIRVNSALGGSTNAPIHLDALARHIGVPLTIDDWQTYGYDIPLLVNLQPAGEYLGEDFYRAGGVPAVVAELMRQGLIDEPRRSPPTAAPSVRTAARRVSSMTRSSGRSSAADSELRAGFLVLRGNLFDSAIMKTSVISTEFRDRYLSNPADPDAFEGRAVVFDGPEDYHARIDDPALGIDEHSLLFMRGAGPIGYPGAAEVVNMRPPADLIKAGRAQPALHRRWPPVRHVGLAVDPQRLAGGGGRRRLGAAADRRSRAHRSAPRRGEYAGRGAELAARRRALQEATATRTRRARRRGRKCSARRSASLPPGRSWNPRLSISAWRRPRACRGTVTSHRGAVSRPLELLESLAWKSANSSARSKISRIAPSP